MGFQDETWWSRLARPNLFAWAPEDKPLRLVEQSLPKKGKGKGKGKGKDDSDPKALAAYGILLRLTQPDCPTSDGQVGQVKEEVWLRFVDGRPISSVTTQFLDWVCCRLERLGKKALLMPWDNASWHVSRGVKTWIREHNRQVKREGKGVRIIACPLPIKSPWLNPIEPRWVHTKRKVVEPDRLLSATELADRVCAVFGCQHDVHLTIPAIPESIPEKVA